MIFYVWTVDENVRGQIVKMGSSWNPRWTPMTQIEYRPQLSWDLARRWLPGSPCVGFRL